MSLHIDAQTDEGIMPQQTQKPAVPPTTAAAADAAPAIRIRGAAQNNLKHLNLDIPIGSFTVVTGLSGSGKSSLVFDTLYAEGQRRYVETFSPYARQFLDRMDRPKVDAIDGVPPAIAIDQNAVIRTSRSTVGTMTEINDRLKLLFAQKAEVYCPHDGAHVANFTPAKIWEDFRNRINAEGLLEAKAAVAFERRVPHSIPLEEALAALSAQGFTRILTQKETPDAVTLTVAADRFRPSTVERARAMEALETALEKGAGEVIFWVEKEGIWTPVGRWRRGRICPECGEKFHAPRPSDFSFNSPVGACPVCRGFGRVITTDLNLVIPDRTKSLLEDAVKPFSTPTFRECKEEMLNACRLNNIPLTQAYEDLSEDARRFIEEGDPHWSGDWQHQWYGIRRFFEWLETKNYKMHVRVLLARYRSYHTCEACGGARLLPEALVWRLGTIDDRQNAAAALGSDMPSVEPIVTGQQLSPAAYKRLPGFNFHELMLLPVSELRHFLERLAGRPHDEAEDLVLREALSRTQFLCDVGLGYLTLNRQGRTLSGGEVQRVNLTTALGTNLVNTLFILDEPSIGLHPRDMDRVNAILRRLTSAGNTLVVVEHDPQVMLAGERLIDLGPGAGANGGQIIYEGSTRGVLCAATETGAYLSGKKRISRKALPIDDQTPFFCIAHAKLNNLKDISVRFPVGRLIAVAGVSGSGKSSLIAETLVPLMARTLGTANSAASSAGEDAGDISSAVLSGDLPSSVEFVDQSSLGRTARGNPASYTGVFTSIREFFGTSSEAAEAGASPADFSFNSGKGRCPHCAGTGWEHVEMQFLSDIYLPCPVCRGRRWQDWILAVRPELDDGVRRSIDEVLDLTVEEAAAAFANHPAIIKSLSLLSLTGLGYLKLGQPLSTLSGGERQRLKLAARIAEGIPQKHRRSDAAWNGPLFVFDEPTTGLHFADTAKLVDIFDRLTHLGATVIVIEHNLDVIGAADWVIELGPDGGAAGGSLIFAGTPVDMTAQGTLTGKALSAWRRAQNGDQSREDFFNLPPLNPTRNADTLAREASAIVIEGAKEHNLKNLSVDIPRDVFTVITGPSGSGKSTLAFDIVFAEGQRRYLESLNAYARSMVQPPPEPDVSSIRGIPPTVAIEQRTTRGGLRSTVATMTEIYHFLRLLYVKLGTEYCPNCGIPVETQTPGLIASRLKTQFREGRVALLTPIVESRKGIFQKELLTLRQKGVTTVRADGRFLTLDPELPKLARNSLHTIEALAGFVDAAAPAADIEETLQTALNLVGATHLCVVRAELVAPTPAGAPALTIPAADTAFYSLDRACPKCGLSLPELDPRLFSYNSEMGACPKCSGYGIITDAIRKAIRKGEAMGSEMHAADETEIICRACGGTRLNPIARNVRWAGKTIPEVCAMTAQEASSWFENLELDDRSRTIANDALLEIRSRLNFLTEVGLEYLTLDRSAPTLSGGETQRIHLASQLGTNLRGVCYVLDEPTIGLHPRDNAMLLSAIERLTQKGNTLLVVEHDEETIRRADHIIDIGPGAGIRGGRLMGQGTVEDLEANPDSPTGRMLAHPLPHTGTPQRRVKLNDPELKTLVFRGIQARNLQIDEITVPLQRFTVVTGVSGSGKSTFCREVLFANLSRRLKDAQAPLVGTDQLTGFENVGRVLEVDQTPIGKNSRSCPATYVGIMTAIRDLYAATNEAQARGYDASRFSFNKAVGACPVCAGQGLRTVEMNFLPDVKVLCEACAGKRFNPETLEVLWRGKSIGDVLEMEIDEAVDFFASMPSIAYPLKLMQDVGLGYLTLGQPSPTLSGGEAQRLKLVTELAKVRTDGSFAARAPHTLYVLDEPTVGLHMTDVDRLSKVLSRLVDAGSTVVVIEHNLDIAADADWIIDLGPEGGAKGGKVVAQGSPKMIARKNTATGIVLKAFLAEHKPVKSA